ncbi:CoA-transferase family III [Pseudonocardia thermophila]|uniref:CoA-transferase family III n=1 Tax=Pseudonocardia thermophila TaxID=1848 RepID=A0A1M6QWZ9_PSETH|nr:CoA transferase [Pseudonocardia thermophila]SHK24725.1 CoA-transferase family III [Pseudonocardia thermophila]
MTDARAVAAHIWEQLGGEPGELDRLEITGPAHTLPSRHAVTGAGAAAVGASLLAAASGPVAVDTRGLAVALCSERYLRIDGRSPGAAFAPLSAFHRTADGWIRLHANYPWHRAAALEVLGAAREEDAAAAIAGWRAVDLEEALHAAGGVAAAVRTADAWWAEFGAAPPLVERIDLAPAAPRPQRRPRVLDLTRVIAGPVATRTLAAHGADVLRLDPPDRPELPAQAWDTLPGKRSALLDARTDAAVLEELLAGADVVVTGYRPGALDRFGLSPEALAERHPGLVVVSLSAWGHRGPWGARRGFDSLVQAACGIAVDEGSPEEPGALPCQLLDHATGYLAAAAALLGLRRQRTDGGTPGYRLALVATAAWLQGLPRTAEPEPVEQVDPAPYVVDVPAPAGVLTLARPPGTVGGRPLTWPDPPPAYGAAAPEWPAEPAPGTVAS